MKFLIVVCAVVACALAHHELDKDVHKKKVFETIKACIEETGAPQEVAVKMMNKDFSNRDEKAQCFVECFFRKAGFFNEKGDMLPDAMIESVKHNHVVKSENFEDLLRRCVKEQSGKNKCETAFKVYECYRSQVVYDTDKAQ